MLAIIDYGCSNLRSVQKAFESQGIACTVTGDVRAIRNADRLVLPGVGAFGAAMDCLEKTGLKQVVQEEIRTGKPFLGICLGMQLLLERSFEGGEREGLGIIPGQVERFTCDLKIPHIGWNELQVKSEDILRDRSVVYFVHSYHCVAEEKYVLARTEYGQTFTSAVRKDNVYGMQFHPEKSGEVGLEILKRFAAVR